MKHDRFRVQSTLPMPRLKRIRLSAIFPAPSAVAAVTSEEVERLAESVRRHGLIQPVGVRKKAGFPVRYELLFGYRRFLACRFLYLPSIPCLVFPEDSSAALLALCENFQRRLPNPAELLRASERLSISAEELCARLPLPCPKMKKDAERRDISLFLSELSEEPPSPAAPVGKRCGIVRDPRLLANSIERAVRMGREAGLSVEVQIVRRADEICYHIRLPLSEEGVKAEQNCASVAS